MTSHRTVLALAFAFGAAGILACTGKLDTPTAPGGGGSGGGPGTGGGSTQPPPPPPPPVPPPAPAPSYVRGSLKTIYQLTPRANYGRIQQVGISMQDSDFESNAVTVSAAQ